MDTLVKVQTAFTEINVIASQNTSLLDSLLDHNVLIDHSCGGNGTCGTCRIIILAGHENLQSPNDVEKEMIEFRQFKNDERLSCQIHPCQNLQIIIP